VSRAARLARAVRAVRAALAGPGDRAPAAPPPGWPAGHFYSPIPDLDDVRHRAGALFGTAPAQLPGIDLRDDAQLAVLQEVGALAGEQPWGDAARAGLRYRFDNPNFQHGEALALHGMLRRLAPRRIVEVGSGWSSCAILDVNDRFLAGRAACVFVEPYPELLRELTPGDDLDVRAVPVQETGLELFTSLQDGDVLFIDSSHVAKVGSDVNHLVHEVLPRLQPGVVVHVHDILYPFEYPQEWVLQGRAWNEAYVLRAFLEHNRAYRIELFLSHLATRHGEALAAALPLAMRSPGSSLWLRRVAGA
jgi:predicted O-methyltransferase YrrM